MNLDLMSFRVVAPDTVTAMAAVTGDPSAIRNSVRGRDIFGLAAWAHTQSLPGVTQILWPSGHDLVRGVRGRNNPANSRIFTGQGFPMAFKPQDPLTVSQSGSATAADVQWASLLLWYEDLPGVAASLINLNQLHARGVQTLTIEDTITPTVSTTYSGARAINAGSDLLKADTWYAVVGAVIAVICGALTVRGPDTGNLRFGFPGDADNNMSTRNMYADLAEDLDLPLIPCFNSANRAGTFVEVLQNEDAAAVPFSLNLVELGPSRQAAL